MFFAGIMEWKRLFNFRACLDVTEPEVTVEELGEDIEVISLGETIKLADLNLYLKYCKSKALFCCKVEIVTL